MKIVITDHEYENIEQELKILHQLPEVEIVDAQCRTQAELINAVRDADAVITQYCRFPKEVIEKMERCKMIGVYAIGFDKIDIEAAGKRGIYVCNVPEYGIQEVADFTLTLILACQKQIFQVDKLIRNGGWGYSQLSNKIYGLENTTVGLVGFGKIPKALTPKLKMLGMNVVAFSRSLTDEDAKEYGIKRVSFEELLKISDIVSCHIPLSDKTRGIISMKELKSMKETAYLVNCGRGGLVDEGDLAEALNSNVIAGAAFDTFEIEPLPMDNPLRNCDNLILTCHMAWYTEEAKRRLQAGPAIEAVRVLTGQEPLSAVNLKLMK